MVATLDYVLTDEERRTFDETGLLIVEDALPPEDLEALTGVVDRLYEERLAAGHNPAERVFFPNFIPEDDLFLDLIDHPRVFPKVWGILGWNIFLYHCHLIVTPPSGESEPEAAKTFHWHQDSGRVNLEMETHPRPRLSLKVAYFMSDTSEPGRGNFWVVPNSQFRDTIELPRDGVGQPEGAIPVLAKPGTAVFFDRRIWHAASPNWSDITRKILFYGYGYRWLRTKDDMTVQDLWERCDPVRRQLLGDGVDCNGHYSPTDDDVPLRVWLRDRYPSAAA